MAVVEVDREAGSVRVLDYVSVDDCGVRITPAIPRAGDLIRIGASLSQTGALAATGQNQLRGYQLCVKHVNEKGGVLGRKLELVVYDDGSDPATAVRVYEKLIMQDKVADRSVQPAVQLGNAGGMKAAVPPLAARRRHRRSAGGPGSTQRNVAFAAYVTPARPAAARPHLDVSPR